MSFEALAITWFGLWGLIWVVYLMLDSYVLGTGMLFPFVTKNEKEEKQLQEAIGPFWGGIETWLVTAGGATFAAFPVTYATMFSYLYTPFMVVLFALFFRAIGLEFMHKKDTQRWRNGWRWAFAVSSFLLPLLFGVAFANIFYGLIIDENGANGSLLSMLQPYGILGGITFVSLALLSGALWISMKTEGAVSERAKQASNVLWFVAALALSIFFVATGNMTNIFDNFGANPVLWIVPALSLAAVLLVKAFQKANRYGTAVVSMFVSIATMMATGFIGLFPVMLPSRIDPAFDITLYEAAASKGNLTVMLIVAVILVPLVIAYQSFMYKIFNKDKISPDNASGY